MAAGERLYSQYKFNQAGTPLISIPKLCIHFNIRKTKLNEILQGGKYWKEEEIEKKPLKRIKPEKIEEAPPKKTKKTEAKKTTPKKAKATPTT